MTDHSKDQTALAKREQGAVDLVSPAAFNDYVAEMGQKAHVLSPVTRIGSLPPMWKIVPAVVAINPDTSGGEVYQDRLFCGEGEVALTKVGLRRLAQAGGMTTGATRLDDGSLPFFWSFQGYIKYRGFDGQEKAHTASVEWDLREGSQQVNRMVKAAERNRKSNDKREAREIAASQIDAARLNGYRNAEARAINAAIREFGLRQKYTTRELVHKPFVVFNMVANPDMSDPEQRRMVLQHALGGVAALYPHAPSAPALPPAGPIDEPPVNHATGEIIEGETTPESRPFEDEPEPQPTFHVTGVFAEGNRFYLTTAETGDQRIYTDDRTTAQTANSTRKSKAPIVLVTESRGKETWIVELTVGKEPL